MLLLRLLDWVRLDNTDPCRRCVSWDDISLETRIDQVDGLLEVYVYGVGRYDMVRHKALDVVVVVAVVAGVA